MTMTQAAAKVLEKLGRAATVREIHAQIVEQELFLFGAKDPVSVLGGAIRRHTAGNKALRGQPVFEVAGKGLYRLASKSE